MTALLDRYCWILRKLRLKRLVSSTVSHGPSNTLHPSPQTPDPGLFPLYHSFVIIVSRSKCYQK